MAGAPAANRPTIHADMPRHIDRGWRCPEPASTRGTRGPRRSGRNRISGSGSRCRRFTASAADAMAVRGSTPSSGRAGEALGLTWTRGGRYLGVPPRALGEMFRLISWGRRQDSSQWEAA
jgi:hypothetical protein